MTPTICRTCLTVLKENSHSFFTLENGIPGITTFREKLNCCIPELALDIIPNAVICKACSMTLNLAYDFKTKCLEMETKIRKYLQSLNDNYVVDHIIYSSSTRWSMDLKPDVLHKSQDSSSRNLEELKQEVWSYEEEASENHTDTYHDDVAEINDNRCVSLKKDVEPNSFTQQTPSSQHEIGSKTLKIKTESDSNEEPESLNTTSGSTNNFNEENYYFTKTLQRLKDNNMNRSLYEQACDRFNLLKVVQTLADQGTEININGLDVSRQNKTPCRNPKQFLLRTPTIEQTQNSLKHTKATSERYDCYYCNRSFDRLSLLKTHTISHTGVKPFTCNICGKGCSHKGELNNHMRTHTGEKPFKCSLCESSFSQISNMKIHMRTHTGEKPYKCDYCEKTFSHKCGVKVHMRTHTGERPYKCEICCKTYTHKKDLDDHMRTHTGEKYRCTICSKEITYKKNLSAHMITHSVKNGSRQGVFKKNNAVKYSPRIAY